MTKKVNSIYYLHFLLNLWMDNSENHFYTEATYKKMKFREKKCQWYKGAEFAISSHSWQTSFFYAFINFVFACKRTKKQKFPWVQNDLNIGVQYPHIITIIILIIIIIMIVILFQSYWFTLGTTILYSCSDCLHVQVIWYIKSEWCSDESLGFVAWGSNEW